jgi:ERF superfamily
MTETATLAAALAELQTKLPRIGKDKTARVTSQRTGKTHTYDYVNLATVSHAILPLLGGLGLSFTSRPTLTEDGQFVLAYSLMHASGERENGTYPLPGSGTPQEIGSAITYARRYSLCAVTGVAPDEDDDDAQAAEAGARVPRNRDGSISRRRATPAQKADAGIMDDDQRKAHNELRKGADGPVEAADKGKLRHCSPGNPCREADCPECTPDADLWTAANPPLRTPKEALSLPAQIAMHFDRLGLTDRDVRLGLTAQLAGTGRIGSSKELTASQARDVLGKLSRCKNEAALRQLLDEGVLADA